MNLRHGKYFPMSKLGGGFKYCLFSPRKFGKIPILTNIFQMGGSTTNQNSFGTLSIFVDTFVEHFGTSARELNRSRTP